MTSTEQTSAEQAPTDPVETEQTPRRWPPLRAVLGALAALVIVALLVAAIFLGYDYWRDHQTQNARTDAIDAANRQTVAMLGYDFKNVDTELPKAADGLTGDFKDKYKNLVTKTIAPGAKEKQLTVKVSVQGSAVVSASPDRVVALLFLNQVTTGKDTPKAVTAGSRIRVNMHKEDGRWLLSDLAPI